MVLNEKCPWQVFLSATAVGQLTYAQHQSKWRDVAKLSEAIRLKAVVPWQSCLTDITTSCKIQTPVMPQVHPPLHNYGVCCSQTFPSLFPRSHHQLFILPSTSLSCHRQLPAAILNTTSHMPRRPLCWNAPFTRCVRYASHLFAVGRQVFRDPCVFSDVQHEITSFPHSAQRMSRLLDIFNKSSF